jgi:hypothetical protein
MSLAFHTPMIAVYKKYNECRSGINNNVVTSMWLTMQLSP